MIDPPHSLYEQSWAPRRQRHGTRQRRRLRRRLVRRPARRPVRYRRAQPIWTDASFASLAPTVSTSCVVAAVRSATAGTSARRGGRRAVHRTAGGCSATTAGCTTGPPPARRCGRGRPTCPTPGSASTPRCCSASRSRRWQAGASLPDGLADAARDVLAHGGGRLTMLASDGAAVAGVVVGEPMHVADRRPTAPSSPPSRTTTTPGWRELADRTVVHRGRRTALTETPLRETEPHDRPSTAHLDAPTDLAASLRADVRAGLTATPEGAAAEVLLRRPRQRAVRGHHPAAGVLPDPRRGEHPHARAPTRSPT